jgi:cob(I)alamin adenosyltransferase
VSKLSEIQTDLSNARLERARLRRALMVVESQIDMLEQRQDAMEDAIAIVGDNPERARQIGLGTIKRAIDQP